MRLHRLETLRTARFAVVGAEGGDAPTEVWYVLHGYRQLAPRFLARFRGIASAHRLIVAPEGLSRFYVERARDEPADGSPDRRRSHGRIVGASWMTNEDRTDEIRDYVRYLDRVVIDVESCIEPPLEIRVVLGFSQGAHTAVRWVVRRRRAPDRLILWGATLPTDLSDDELNRLARVEMVIVRGMEDSLRDPVGEARDDEWFARSGVPARLIEHPGGHEIDPEVLDRLVRGETGSSP